jgi:hypothetical protein
MQPIEDKPGDVKRHQATQEHIDEIAKGQKKFKAWTEIANDGEEDPDDRSERLALRDALLAAQEDQ